MNPKEITQKAFETFEGIQKSLRRRNGIDIVSKLKQSGSISKETYEDFLWKMLESEGFRLPKE